MATKRTRRTKIDKPDWIDEVVILPSDWKSQLKWVIKHISDMLYFSLHLAMPGASLDDFNKIMWKIIAEDKVTDYMMSEEWADRISENNADRKLNSYKLSHLYCYLAEKARKNGESDKGWSLIEKARTYCELYNAIDKAESSQKYTEDRPEKN